MSKDKTNLVDSQKADEFFLSTKTIARPLPVKSSLALFFSTILISLCAGFLAGLVQGNLVDRTLLIDQVNTDKSQEPKFNLSFLVNDDKNSEHTKQVLNNYVAGIYLKKATSTTLDAMYLPTDFLGTGMVVTSDGWLIVPSEIIGDKKFVVVVNKQVYEPTKQVVDKFNKSLLIKIDAKNLTPANYVKEDSVNNYEAVFAVRYDQQNQIEAIRTSVKSNNFSARTDLKSYIKTTDTIDHWLVLNNQLPKEYNGALIMNQLGLVVGQLNAKADLVIPHYYVASTVNQFLDKSQIVVRPEMGIYYLQIDETVGLPNDMITGSTYGALITSDGLKVDAVKKESSAEKAGLLTGDIVLKVNEQEVNSNNSLTKLIQEYTPGTKINFSILRKGEKKDIEVVVE